jgi:hypothetical protein
VVWFCQYAWFASGFVVIPILHGMRFFRLFLLPGRCRLEILQLKEERAGSHVYMHPAEHDENYNNPLTHTLEPNPILALQFYYYYITSEGSVNTPFIVLVSLLLNSRDTILG